MKKKVLGILSCIFVLFVCLTLSACKGRYDNMKFKVLYAFSEDAETWLDGTNGIDAYYGTGDDMLPQQNDGWAKIYIKIDVLNVKSKYVDNIFVSGSTATGTDFSNRTVKEGTVFSVGVKGKASLELTLLETLSKKSKKVQVNASYPLERIEANYDANPTVVMGSTIDLNNFSNLNFYPINKTNQTQVKYEINRVGYFVKTAGENNEFVGITNKAGVNINDSKLKVDSNFNFGLERYAIEIVATSIYDASKTATFYVYVVTNDNNLPIVKYYNNNGENNAEINSNVTLYSNSQFSTATLVVGFENVADIFKNNRYVTYNSVAKLVPQIYVGGSNVPVEVDKQSQKEDLDFGLHFNRGIVENVFSITATTNSNASGVDVVFKLEFNVLNFGNANINSNSKKIVVQKGQLATGIKIDDEILENNDNFEAKIYSTNKGTIAKSLILSAVNSSNANEKIYIRKDNNLTVSPYADSSKEFVYTNKQINVNFANTNTGSGNMSLRVRSNPEQFQGLELQEDWITVNLTFKKVITANGFAVYRDKNFESQISNRELRIGVGITNNLYLRVYYSNGEFNNESAESVVLESSGQDVQFVNNQAILTELSLDKVTEFGERGQETINPEFVGQNYVQYKISFSNINSNAKSTSITIYSGAKTLRGVLTFNAVPTLIATGEFDITPSINTTDAVRMQNDFAIDNGHINYAVVFNKTVFFDVVGKQQNMFETTSEVVNKIDILNFDNADFNSANFTNDAVDINKLSNNFQIRSVKANKTRVVKIAVSYYAFDSENDCVVLKTGDQAKVLTIEFAVFVPIDHFEISPALSTLTHINNNIATTGNYSKYTQVDIEYKALSEYMNSTPSQAIYFTIGSDTEPNFVQKNPNQINLAFSPSIDHSSLDILRYEDENPISITENSVTFAKLQGKIKVTLTNESVINNLILTFNPNIFGQIKQDAQQTSVINFQTCAVAKTVEIYGQDIQNRVENSNYISVSYIDTENGKSVVKKFNAVAVYDDLDSSKLQLGLLDYKIRKVENGVVSSRAETNIGVELKFENGQATLTATNNGSNGGLYLISIFAPDSYNEQNEENPYSAINYVYLEISNGDKNSPYALYNAQDFEKIRNNNTLERETYYVLGADFTVDLASLYTDEYVEKYGDKYYEFYGNLSGEYSVYDNDNNLYKFRYTLTIVLNDAVSSGLNNYIGLFPKINSRAKISNLNLDVVFDLDQISTTSGDVYIGGLAGINEGEISNVDVNLKYNNVNLNVFSSSNLNNVWLGGLVGVNDGNGRIYMQNSTVTSNGITVLPMNNVVNNIGLIAGENRYIIEGNYLGKSSLNSVAYSIVADLTIKDTKTNIKYAKTNVGAVAGLASGISLIRNILVGGKIELQDFSNSELNYLGGIVGNASNDVGIGQKGIYNCATLGLDLTNKIARGYVGGIAGKTDNVTVSDVRVMATYAKFNGFATQGKLNGTNVVAGVVADLNGGSIANASVESFIDSINNDIFYMFESASNKVYGLACQNSNATITSSFVNANIKNVSSSNVIYLTSNATESYTYYLGKINDIENNFENADFVNVNDNCSYAVVYDSENIYYYNHSTGLIKCSEDNLSSWDTFVKTDLTNLSWTENSATNFALQDNKNLIKIGEASYYFPYLVSSTGEVQMVERPSKITAKFNDDYAIYTNSHIITVGEIVITSEQIKNNLVDIIFVNYLEFEDKNKKDEEYNTHNLINTDEENPNGLIDLSVLPDGTQGGVKFEVVNILGYNYARIINSSLGDKIVFSGVSGNLPIIVRAYSIFNPEAQYFVVFFTQNGISKLNITSTSTTVNASGKDADFELVTYTNAAPIILNFKADNIFEGQRFKTLFDNLEDYSNYISIEAEENDIGFENSVLQIAKSSSKTALQLSVVKDFENYYYEGIITFSLYLNLKDYIEGNGFTFNVLEGKEKLLVAQVSLKVMVFKSTEKIEPSFEAKQVDSETPIVLDVTLKTSFVEADDDDTLKNGGSKRVGDFVRNGNSINFNETGKDSLILNFKAKNENDLALKNLLEVSGETFIANLFDITNIYYKFYYENQAEERVLKGYVYTIEFVLKGGYNYRHIVENIELILTINSTTNPNPSLDKLDDLAPEIELTITPTEFKSARIYNYAASDMQAENVSKKIVTSNSFDSNYISPAPNSYGSILAIHLQPNYSIIKDATISSNSVNVPSLTNPVYLILSQVVPVETGVFKTVIAGSTGSSLKLNTSPEYVDENGIIYVHAMVSESFSGYAALLKLTLSAEVGDVALGTNKTIKVEKELLTTYLPGVYLSYDSSAEVSTESNAYFIEEGTYDNSVGVTLYGYELQSKPSISFVWNVDESSKYDYLRDENGEVLDYGTLVDKENKANTYLIGDYIGHSDVNNFDNLQANPDGSITFYFNIYFFKQQNLDKPIPASFKVNVALEFSDGNKDEKSLTFYPVEYLLKGASLEGMFNNNFYANISASTMLKFRFITTNPNFTIDDQAKVYEDIINSFIDFDVEDPNITEKELDIQEQKAVKTLAHAFSFTGSTSGYFDDANLSAFTIIYNKIDKHYHISIEGVAETQLAVTFRLNYAYVKENGMYKIHFGTENQFTGTNSLEFNFNLIISVETSQDKPIPLFKDDFVSKINQYAGADFILMEDVDLYDFTPISTNIASLDGNNKIIRIHSFSVAVDRTEYGLFAHIGSFESNNKVKNTILKNVIVDYSQFEDLRLARNNATSFVFGGLVATVNDGALIYNCDVMNINNLNQTKTVNIIVDDVRGTTVTFGGLVGVNNGIITNSRVGRLKYKRITYTISQGVGHESTDERSANPINFALGANLGEGVNSFVGIAAGFVGVNNGTIASSYVANTSLYSYSAVADETNKTAGFVAENNGTIKLSYVKGLEDTITSGDANNAQMRATGAKIVGAANANVAGFVYSNSNLIENCFANIELETKSAFLAGFVYENLEGANIDMCYSACKLNLTEMINNSHEQPFVGVDASNQMLSFGSISNSYYLEETGSEYTLPTNYEGLDQAIGLNGNNFANYSTLNNFVFIRSEDNEIRNQGIWTYTTIDTNQNHILPELTSANIIANSYRILKSQEDNDYIYDYAPSYNLGNLSNPYIISNADEFNIVLTGKKDNSTNKQQGKVGYIRMINNIDFENLAILTRSNFSLGDKMSYSITSFEGNGMTISNIYLDVLNLLQTEGAQSNSLEKVGLFAEMNNAYFKNVDLEFASLEYAEQNPTIPIKYSGGLAGVINNSAIINVNLIGNNTTIAGSNFVGGVAGLISGNSFIYGVTTNLGAISGSYPNDKLYYNEEDFLRIRNQNRDTNIRPNENYESYLSTLSYAGGVAGVLDLQKREYLEYNLSNIDVLGNNMNARAEGNIVGNFAGGVAGFASRNTNALKLRFYVGNSTSIKGVSAVGGLYGIGMGRYDESGNEIPSLTACQVTESEDIRYNIDTNFGNYIIDLEKNGSASLADNIGNKNLLISEGYAGGLVGISIGQSFESSYAKTSLNWAKTFGGAVGLSIASTLTHVYAVPYVNLSNNVITNVGGLVGIGYEISNSATQYGNYISYAKYLLKMPDKKTDIVYNFSTLLLDNNELSNILAGEVEDDGKLVKIVDEQGHFVKNIDYLVAQYVSSNGNCYVNSNNIPITAGNLSVYVGQVNNYAQFEETKVINNSTKVDAINLSELFDKEDVDQPVLFKNIFGDWPTKYWNLDFEKYFPLLLKKEALNYIIIDEPNDFNTLLENPDLNYKIVKDIDMSGWEKDGNWVFDVDFTGTLIGEVGEGQGNLPKVYNLHKTTSLTNNTAGLFRKTTGATIKDIDWIWSDVINTTGTNSAIDFGENVNDLTIIGGVSCEDKNSKFNNLHVYVGNYYPGQKVVLNGDSIINNKYYEENNLNTRTISAFGGIVGNGINSQIENCLFNGNAKLYLTNNNGNVYFGGLVGSATKSETVENSTPGYQARSIVMTSSVGIDENIASSFDIKLGDARSVYIGGAVGYAYLTSVSTINVGTSVNSKAINFNLEVQDKGNIYVGGLIGNESDCSVSDANAISNIIFKTIDTSGNSAEGTLNVGGLIGLVEQSVSSSASGIRDASVLTNIDLTELNMSYINVAGGIAVVTTGSLVDIEQSAIVGTINSEKIDETGSEGNSFYLNNIHSGGVVAKQTGSGSLNIKEVATAVDISIGTDNSQNSASETTDKSNKGTTSLYMGGLVGEAEGSVFADNCFATGKFIPITTSSDQNYNIYVGGFVGLTNKFSFANSISTVSIIADSINSQSIKQLHIHALLGDVVSKDTMNCNNVFYSSDIALFPEDLCSTARNINAYTLTKRSGNVNWQEQLILSGSWVNTTLTTGMYGLPTLANRKIISKLKEYGIIEGEESSGERFVAGKPSNPIEIVDLEDIKLYKEFNYYILVDELSTSLKLYNIDLNGVLIVGDVEYSINCGENSGEGTGDQNKGVFAEIKRHSAVSNLHVWVGNKNSDVQTDNNKNLNLTNALNFGVIAGLNRGVVFNCSVQGTGLIADTAGTDAAGLVVGRNAGLVSYSYSSAEIARLTGSSLSGIVNINVDKILSCYFTGYIDNASHHAAGIVLTNDSKAGDEEKGKTPYIYNCYMAGVIVNINGNSFVGDENGLIKEEKAIGSRNFIDVNVNKKDVSQKVGQDMASGNVNCLSTIDTHILMANTNLTNNILEGNWLTSAKTRLLFDAEQYYIDTYSPSYGYNYLYPVYNFNKESAANNIINNTDFVKFQLYTGTGGNEKVLSDEFVSSHDKNVPERNGSSDKVLVVNGDETYYKNALKIPHLGVLKAIQGLSTTIVKASNMENGYTIKHTDLNYVIIYDINGRPNANLSEESNYNWVAIGSQEGNGFISKQAQFNGLVVSNKFYDYSTQEKAENYCVIKNLSGQGLFDNINSAYFGYFILGDFTNLENSGALGVTVNSDSGNEVVVENLFYLDVTTYTSVENKDNYISAMFGKLDNFANVKIKNSGVKDSATQDPDLSKFESSGYITLANGNYMGLIVGDFEKGSITFDGYSSLNVNFEAASLDGKDYYAGGLIGKFANGNIFGSDIKTAVLIVPQSNGNASFYKGAVKIGGIIGFAQTLGQTDTKSSISNIKVGFPSKYTAAGFGGLVYKSLQGNVTFENCELATKDEVELTLRGESNFFGFVAAEMEDDESSSKGITVQKLTVADNVKVTIQLETKLSFTTDDINVSTQGFGGLVGRFNGGNLAFNASRFNVTLQVRSANVGGVAGYFSKGHIGMFCPNDEESFKVTLSGYYNVGGAFGYYTGSQLSDINLKDNENQGWSILNAGYAFATIKSFDSASSKDLQEKMTFANWGGLFGYFNHRDFSGLNIRNNNNIEIGTVSVETNGNTITNTPTLKNVGGVAGKVKATNDAKFVMFSTNITNNGNIDEKKEETNDDSSESGGNTDAVAAYNKVEMDGDVFLIRFSAGSKSSESNKYYFAISLVNVGGIFGNIENAEITIGMMSSGYMVTSYCTVFGYQNVGGLIGYAKDVSIEKSATASDIAKNCTVENSKIYGVVNVGGAIGALDNESQTITSITVENNTSVYGNFNVGGVVGYIARGTISNCIVNGKSEISTNVTVKGIYFSIIKFIGTEGPSLYKGDNTNKEAFFFPANVGGFVGSSYIPESNWESYTTLSNNELKNVLVTSSVEGQISAFAIEKAIKEKIVNESTVISTVNNAVLYTNKNINLEENINLVNDVIAKRLLSTSVEVNINNNFLQDFNAIKTGFGGFAGSIDGTAVMQQDSSNNMSNVVVDAGLGINVGSFYGYYYANKTLLINSTQISIRTQNLTGDIFVSGAYFVGGIAGNVEVDGSGVTILQFNSDISKGNILADMTNGAPTIYIQTGTYNMGLYVGGLFGNVKGNANGLIINGNESNSVQFKMNNLNSYYAGGLIGRLEGNLGDGTSATNSNIVNAKNDEINKDSAAFALIAGNYNDIISTDETIKDNAIQPVDITSAQATENFGGLVGMLKRTTKDTVKDENGNINTYVKGWHPFAFTINTIENQNYADGETTYDYTENEDDVYLQAYAYYVNLDDFTISYSRGGLESEKDRFNYVEHKVNNIDPYYEIQGSYWFSKDSNNPLNEDSYGWAKEYTLVKTIQRNIPKEQNANKWDSIAIVYDASKITYVATVENSYRDNSWFKEYDLRITSYVAQNYIAYEYKPSTKEDDEQTFETISLYNHYFNNNKLDAEGFNGHIFFTIYNYTDSTPVLYSRMGIARALKDSSGNFTNKAPESSVSVFGLEDIKATEASTNLVLGGGNVYYDLKKGDNCLGTLTLSYLPWYYEQANVNKKENGWWIFKKNIINAEFSYGVLGNVKYYVADFEGQEYSGEPNIYTYKDDEWVLYTDGKNDGYKKGYLKNFLNDHQEIGVNNFMSNYSISVPTSQNSSVVIDKKTNFVYNVPYFENNSTDTMFVFSTVFENWTSNLSGKNIYSNDNLAKDGSIFNVSSMLSESAWGNVSDKIKISEEDLEGSFWQSFEKTALATVLLIAAALLSVVAIALTDGGAIPVIASIIGIFASALSAVTFIAAIVNGVISLFSHLSVAQELMINKIMERKDMSFGLIGDSYNREIEYTYDNGQWILNNSCDSIIFNEDEFGVSSYAYYSSVRPNDFYQNYYSIGTENEDVANSKNVQMSDIFIHVAKEDVELTYDSDGKMKAKYKGIEISDTDDSIYKLIRKTYLYYNGAYYINIFSSEIKYTPSQIFAQGTLSGFNSSQYVDEGYLYVQGLYNDDGSYKIVDKYIVIENNNKINIGNITGSNLTWEGGNSIIKNSKALNASDDKFLTADEFEEIYGVPFAKQTAMPVKFIPVGKEKTKTDGSISIGSSLLAYKKNGNILTYKAGDLDEHLYKGYGYMFGAYYTVNSSYNNLSYNDVILKKCGQFKFAGYEYEGIYHSYNGKYEENGAKPTGNQGIDYIIRNYEFLETGTGNTKYLTIYYTFAGETDETGEDYDPILKAESQWFSLEHFERDIQNSTWNVNLYPYSFVNPYSVDPSKAEKDEIYYINENIETSSSNGIPFNVTYFYYDGGYDCDFSQIQDPDNSSNYSDGSGIVFSKYHDVSKMGISTTTENMLSDLYGEEKIYLYTKDADGNVKKVKYNKNEGNPSNSNFTIINEDPKNPDNSNYITLYDFADLWYNRMYTNGQYRGESALYGYWYNFKVNTNDDNEVKIKDIYIGEDCIDMYKLVNNYRIKSNKEFIYTNEKGSTTYNIYEIYTADRDYSVKNGFLVKNQLNIPQSLDEGNKNKYLMNDKYGFYTRYKYTNGKVPLYSDDTTLIAHEKGKTKNIFETGEWVEIGIGGEIKYFLFNNSRTPNERRSTYLSEGVIVTLGGNTKVYTSPDKTQNNIGSFTAV